MFTAECKAEAINVCLADDGPVRPELVELPSRIRPDLPIGTVFWPCETSRAPAIIDAWLTAQAKTQWRASAMVLTALHRAGTRLVTHPAHSAGVGRAINGSGQSPLGSSQRDDHGPGPMLISLSVLAAIAVMFGSMLLYAFASGEAHDARSLDDEDIRSTASASCSKLAGELTNRTRDRVADIRSGNVAIDALVDNTSSIVRFLGVDEPARRWLRDWPMSKGHVVLRRRTSPAGKPPARNTIRPAVRDAALVLRSDHRVGLGRRTATDPDLLRRCPGR